MDPPLRGLLGGRLGQGGEGGCRARAGLLHLSDARGGGAKEGVRSTQRRCYRGARNPPVGLELVQELPKRPTCMFSSPSPEVGACKGRWLCEVALGHHEPAGLVHGGHSNHGHYVPRPLVETRRALGEPDVGAAQM